MYLSSIAKDSDELLNKWADADSTARCPLAHHEFAAPSNRGRRRRQSVHHKQNRSMNKRANIAHQSLSSFEYKYDKKYMQCESHQITDYQAAEIKRKSRKRKKR